MNRRVNKDKYIFIFKHFQSQIVTSYNINSRYFEKMKTIFTFLILGLIFSGNVSYGTSFKIKNSGTSFTPATSTVNVGDEIEFEISSDHNAVQVSKATWDANGNTSNGGFSVPFGGGKIILNTPGTYYYVCAPHASLGMKGTIIVNSITGVTDPEFEAEESLKVYPNPAKDFFNVNFKVTASTSITIDLLDITGRKVKSLVASEYSFGSYSENFPVNGLVPGRYFVRYLHGGKSEVAKVIVENNL
jgi:plastocyanin